MASLSGQSLNQMVDSVSSCSRTAINRADLPDRRDFRNLSSRKRSDDDSNDPSEPAIEGLPEDLLKIAISERFLMPCRFHLATLSVFLCITSAVIAITGFTMSPDERLDRIEQLISEGSYRSAVEGCEALIEDLVGEQRGRCAVFWAIGCEHLHQHSQLHTLFEREIDRIPFPFSARLAEIEGRRRSQHWGGWHKLRPLELALSQWESNDSTQFSSEWCSTAFDLIEGLSTHWQYDMPVSEWEKQPQPEDPEERTRAYEKWRRKLGLAEDRRRLERVDSLYAGILEHSEDNDTRARVYFERAMRRLAAIGVTFFLDPMRSMSSKALVEQLRTIEKRGKPAADRLQEWREKCIASISDWETLIAEIPNDSRADDASYLIGWVKEFRLGELVAAKSAYSALLEKYPESQWRSDAQSNIDSIEREQVTLTTDTPVTSPGTAPILSIEARNVSQLQISVWRVNGYLNQVESQSGLTANPARASQGDPLSEWQLETGCLDNHKSKLLSCTLPIDQPGVYRVRILGQQSTTDLLVFISGMALQVEGGSDEAFAWLTNRTDGRPIANAEVLLRLDITKSGHTRSWTTRINTDQRGLVRWQYPEKFIPLLEDGWHLQEFAAVAQLGDELVPAPPFRPTFDGGRRPRFHYYLETDRPAYRPGQAVQYKITIRKWNGESYQLPRLPNSATITMLDPRGQELLKETAALDGNGATSGSLDLSTEAALGMCQLKVSIEGSEIPPTDWRRSAFRIEEYRLPEFEVAIDAPSQPVLYGDPLNVVVRGNYLSGEPVRGGAVRIRVERSPYHFDYKPHSYLPWDLRHPHRMRWTRESVYSGEAILDPDGIAEFVIPTSELGDGLDSDYFITAWLTDSSQREEVTSSSFPVTATELFAHLHPERKLVTPGEPIQIDVRTLDATKVGRSSAGEIETYRRVDSEELVDGELQPITNWELISRRPLRVDAAGTQFREVAAEEGEWKFTYRSTDPRGKSLEASCHLWVVGPEFKGRDYTIQGLELITSTPVARVNSTAKLAILTERPNATILVLRSAAGQVLELETVQAKGQVAQLSFPVTVADSPNFFITAWAIWDGEIHRSMTTIDVPPDPYFLTGTLTTDHEELLPGEEVELSLKLTDYTGQPVEGTWSLRLYDRSILAIQPEIGKNPMQHFHERRWSATMLGSSSIAWRSITAFKWLSGYKPIQRPTHRLPDLLQQSWKRKHSYYSDQFFSLLIETDGSKLGGESLLDEIRVEGASAFYWQAPSETLDFAYGTRLGSLYERSRSPMSKGTEEKELDRRVGAVAQDGGVSANFDGASDYAPVSIRSNFSATAAWEPNFQTNSKGIGSLRVTMPDTLTAWNGIARGIDPTGRTFEARVEIRTQRNVRLRLATPRFLREGDQTVVSLIASNQFDQAVEGKVYFEFPHPLLAYRGTDLTVHKENEVGQLAIEITVPSGGEKTIDLPFEVIGTGEVEFSAILATPQESDGLIRSLPSLPFGLDRYIGAAGIAIDADGFSSDGWSFVVPELSDQASRSLSVDLTPSPAIALIESLPYLVQFPYGCVEQTLNRFVPAVIVANLLKETGIDLAEILPERPSEIPDGFWGHLKYRPLEVLRPEDLTHLLEQGETRLRKAQNSDGSWGWWQGYRGDPYITALVVDHLLTAHEAGVNIDLEPVDRAVTWLMNHAIGRDYEGELDLYERPGLEDLVWVTRSLLHASRAGRLTGETKSDAFLPLLDFLYKVRSKLGAQGQALLALALHDSQNSTNIERAQVVIRNLYDEQGGQDQFGTIHFGRKNVYAWYDHGVESTAWALRALVQITPADPRITKVVRWLLENREGSHYDSTRSTAAAALAITDVLRTSRELDCDLEAEVFIDGNSLGTYSVDRSTLFTSRGHFEIPAEFLEPGDHQLEIRRGGRGALHWSAGLSFYSREDPVPAAGNRVEITRKVSRIIEEKRPRHHKTVINGKPVVRTVEEWHQRLVALGSDATLKAGDRILVEIDVTSANLFRYVALENPKPAGFEFVSRQSGFVGGTYGYRELRDEKAVWFVSRLPEGKSSVQIELRAERDGFYRVVPATIEAMYLPHVRGNSESGSLSIR